MREKMLNRIKSDIKTVLKDIPFPVLKILVIYSVCVNLLIEILGQFKYGGFFEAFDTIFKNPLVFIYNTAIVLVTISFCLFFKRVYFSMVLLSVIWIGLGIANCVVLACRVTPFSAVELRLLDAAMGVMESYVSVGLVLLVIAAVLIVAAFVIFLWKKAPVLEKINYFSSAVCVVVFIVLLNIFTFVGLKTNVISTSLPNLSKAYVDYGFVYCFSNSLINTGINKPRNYSEKKVIEINDNSQEKLTSVASNNSVSVEKTSESDISEDKLPNVLFLQLESFFDITAVERLGFSEDPIPFFRECMNKYTSGYLSVPAVGAGTANTEFEIITGMNLDFFGPGEYPYKTVLKEKTCETVCYDLKAHGYTTQAIHNNRASFYGRNTVFSYLGFDYFTSLELMDVKEYTPNGWAKDSILTDEIIKAMSNTSQKDFIYTISVQGHGGYPTVEDASSQALITLDYGYESEEERVATEYYINQIHEMDEFLKNLVNSLDEYKESTGEDIILVAYGDHLPTLYFDEEDLVNKNQYQTQYFVYNTMNLPVEKEDIQAYQLSSRIMQSLNISDGEINLFHQANRDELQTNLEKYLEDLKVLGYDMFYGDNYGSGGEALYEPTDIKYGVTNVAINNVFKDQSDEDYLVIRGKYFTNYSTVYVNDELVDSEFLDTNTLRISLEDIKEDIQICVKQTYKGNLILQESNIFTYKPLQEESLNEYRDYE